MSNSISINSLYTTSDMAMAATLSLWIPIDSIDQSVPQKSYFVFKRDAQLDRLIEQYWRGELRVEPKIYFSALRTLKARLYEERNINH